MAERWAILWIGLAAIGGMWIGAYLMTCWFGWASKHVGEGKTK